MYKLDLKKAEDPEIKLPRSVGSQIKQENSRKTSTSASLTTQKLLTVWITIHCGNFFKRWEYQTILPAYWAIYMQVKKEQLELNMEQWTGSKLGKEYVKAVYCNSAYLTSRQSASCEMPGWVRHKLESRMLGETSITLDMQMTPPWNFLLYTAPMILSTIFPQCTRTFFLLLLFKYTYCSIIWKTIHMCFFLLFSCLNKWAPKQISEQNEPPKARLTDTIITSISEFCMLEFYNTVDELWLSVEPGIVCSSPQKSKHPDL